MDRGLLYAEACFETMRVIHGEVFDWPAHARRLAKGLAAFGLEVPKGLKEQCLQAGAQVGDDAVVRLTVSGGTDAWGLLPGARRYPGVYIQARPYMPASQPIALCSATWPLPLRERPAKFTADYADTLRALVILRNAGLSTDAMPLICDARLVYSALAANLLLYRQGQWWTPAGGPVMPGVVRQHLCGEGCATAVPCPRAWLHDCEALVLTNSVAFILTVASIDGRQLPPAGKHLLPLYQALHGRPGVPKDPPCV